MSVNPYYLLFLPFTSGEDYNTRASSVCPQEIKWLISAIRLWRKVPRAPAGTLMTKIRNPRKVPFIVGVWEFGKRIARRALDITNPQSPTEVGNIREFGS